MASRTMEKSGYKKEPSNTPEDWKKWKAERRAEKRKWKEEELIRKLEKEKKKEEEELARKKLKEEDENKKKEQDDVYTLSIALPGSILDNAQSPEMRTYLAGQIARAAVIFKVNEIVIFDELGTKSTTTEGSYAGIGKKGHANVQMARILQYLECPQYLRKNFFPQHKDLQYAGLLNPLDCPHHVKAHEESLYREGVVLDKPVKEGRGSYVNVGLTKEIQIDKKLQPGVRVTVKLQPGYLQTMANKKKVRGCVVSPAEPLSAANLYWGYSVRLAASLSKVFTESPYSDGYDMMIGTSEKGTNIDTFTMERYKHLLIVFGGVQGLEYSLDSDPDLHIEDPQLLFTHYLNTCPSQGSNTIRTEEAILITLAAIRFKKKHLDNSNPFVT